VNTVFKNYREKQLATKIPISGDLSNPDVDTWTAVVKVLENAFVQAISPDLDGSVNLGNLSDTEKELKEEAKRDKKAQRKERREEKREERRERREEKKDKKKD
jgi:sRNA-binding protein